jgi:hypothetical protein
VIGIHLDQILALYRVNALGEVSDLYRNPAFLSHPIHYQKGEFIEDKIDADQAYQALCPE